MERISGKAIDYDIDQQEDANKLNDSLSRFYSKLSQKDQLHNSSWNKGHLEDVHINEVYPQHNARFNFLLALQGELSYERNFLRTELIIKKGERNSGYMDRLLMYLIDKMCQAYFSSFELLKASIRSELNPDQSNDNSQRILNIYPHELIYLKQKICLLQDVIKK